ncbi:YciI family protein [Effusibacillus lacus]|uniref:YCII-related domain-containing protein n=1 Tax=Effusibacillus lacus TaxID=1348429 RepID=A0A292YIF9_9BACL|nr:YciI family protein [Effusibacillus lacus]TCS74632.1 uncharacterized protein YciI [Effusibacillus lacus]GAX88503.1 hypothetical protein EFBL_0112 [Effusibacillus lacus]
MNTPDNQFIRYVILLTKNPGQSLTENLIRAHVKHLQALEEKDQLVLCGPFADSKGGMIIIKAASYEEAKRIAEADPFVQSGAESYELRVLELSCKENRHMGMAE